MARSGPMEFMFSIPLFTFKVSGWKDKKQRILRALPKVTDEYLSLDKDSYTDFYRNDQGRSLPPYAPTVTDCLSDCLREFRDSGYPDDPVISAMWFEKSLQSNYHGVHNHGSLGYSAVLFVEFDPREHTATRFLAPFMSFYAGGLIDYTPKNVEEGTLMIFPAIILHEAQADQSGKPRTVIAFNIDGAK